MIKKKRIRKQPVCTSVSPSYRYEGDGRLKQCVKRSLQSLLKPVGLDKDCLTTLFQTLTAATWTQIVTISQLRTQSIWLGSTRVLDQYIASRMLEHDPLASMPYLVNAGLDLMGPSRILGKRKADKQQPLCLQYTPSDGAAASSSAVVEEPAPHAVQAVTQDHLAALLQWEGNLTDPLAVSRAAAIMQYVVNMTDELATTKFELEYYKQRAAMEAKVCCSNYHAFSPKLNPPSPLCADADNVTPWPGSNNDGCPRKTGCLRQEPGGSGG